MDESMLTGEPMPGDKKSGTRSGRRTLNGTGCCWCVPRAPPPTRYSAQIIRHVLDARRAERSDPGAGRSRLGGLYAAVLLSAG